MYNLKECRKNKHTIELESADNVYGGSFKNKVIAYCKTCWIHYILEREGVVLNSQNDKEKKLYKQSGLD